MIHFSENENCATALPFPQNLISDAVEFETIPDCRSGKPIASKIIKLSQGTISNEIISEESLSGLVVLEAKPSRQKTVSS